MIHAKLLTQEVTFQHGVVTVVISTPTVNRNLEFYRQILDDIVVPAAVHAGEAIDKAAERLTPPKQRGKISLELTDERKAATVTVAINVDTPIEGDILKKHIADILNAISHVH